MSMNKTDRSFGLKLLTASVTASLLLSPASAQAAGFFLQEQSVTALGSAFAGAGAEARDASIMFYNPAGMAQLKGGAQITGGVSVLKAWANNDDQGSTITSVTGVAAPALTPTLATGDAGGDSDNPIPVTAIPNLYAATPISPISDDLWAGIGFSVPFGLSTKYHGEWAGRFDSKKSVLRVIDIQPTLAYKVNDYFSIGGGVNVQRASAELTNAVSNGVNEGEAKLKGHDWSVGYNLGVIVKPFEETTFGLTYRSKVDHDLKGNVIVTGAGPGTVPVTLGGVPITTTTLPGLTEDSNGGAKLNLPDIIMLSASQGITDKWKLLGQVNYFHWGRFNEIRATRSSDGSVAELVPEDYGNTFSYGVGAEYAWRPDTTFRFGYQFDQTPTHSPFRDTRVPDGNRHNFAGGISYDISKNFTLNGAVSYSFMQDSNVSVSRNAGLADVEISRDDTTFLFGAVGVTYKF